MPYQQPSGLDWVRSINDLFLFTGRNDAGKIKGISLLNFDHNFSVAVRIGYIKLTLDCSSFLCLNAQVNFTQDAWNTIKAVASTVRLGSLWLLSLCGRVSNGRA